MIPQLCSWPGIHREKHKTIGVLNIGRSENFFFKRKERSGGDRGGGGRVVVAVVVQRSGDFQPERCY